MNQYSFYLYKLTQLGYKITPETIHKIPTDINKLMAFVKKLEKCKQSPLPISWDEYCAQLESNQVNTITYFDREYPGKLKELYDPPMVLFYKGNSKILSNACLSVVGSRRASHNGLLTTQKILKPLSNSKLVIISGLAYGIDAAAHSNAIEYNLPTCAVLGGGLADQAIYPKSNFPLARRIVNSGGLLISEYLPNSKPRGYHFIARNRIIAALSDATLIIECQQKSGALTTADFASQLNRPVIVTPGSILSNNNLGSNRLMQQGALVICTGEDIAELLQIPLITYQAKTVPLSSEEKAVLKYINNEGLAFDDLKSKTKLNTPRLLSILSQLELKSLILSPAPSYYQKIDD